MIAVSPFKGLVHKESLEGSINMDVSAAFVAATYKAVLSSQEYRDDFDGKHVVIVVDNAPAHSQVKERTDKVLEDEGNNHEFLKILCLGPYSPMCNPCENCFSVMKAFIKSKMKENRNAINSFNTWGQIASF